MGERGMTGIKVKILDRSSVERLAHIIGKSSAAALALAELDRRNAAGEDLVLVKPSLSDSILIVPRADLKDAPPSSAPLTMRDPARGETRGEDDGRKA